MLCVITHTYNDSIDSYDVNHRKQFNNVIKILFNGLSEDELHVTLDLFCSDYTDFNQNNGHFYGD